jgi:23S rRNA pseudouridine2605 synthase
VAKSAHRANADRPIGRDDAESNKLQKVLASAGLGSRREIERWIEAGRVSVNAEIAHTGQRVQPTDVIAVDGRRVAIQRKLEPQVLILNKSAGTVCTRQDPEGRPTIFAELPQVKSGRWVGVGRLDIQTTGLLLLTNDGSLANKLMHPSTGLDREYAVRINAKLENAVITQLLAGVMVEGELLKFSDIRYYDGSGNNFWYHVVLLEGKNREVRRLFESVGCSVSRLKRVRYGPVVLPSWLRVGQWAALQDDDVKQLYRLMGLAYRRPQGSKAQDKSARGARSRVAKTTCLLPYPKLNLPKT